MKLKLVIALHMPTFNVLSHKVYKYILIFNVLSHSKEDSEHAKDKLVKKKQRGKALTEDEESDLAKAMEATKTHKLHIQRLRRTQRELFAALADICERDFPELPLLYPQDGLVQEVCTAMYRLVNVCANLCVCLHMSVHMFVYTDLVYIYVCVCV